MYSLIYMFTVCQCTIYVICIPLYTDIFPNPRHNFCWGFCNLIKLKGLFCRNTCHYVKHISCLFLALFSSGFQYNVEYDLWYV